MIDKAAMIKNFHFKMLIGISIFAFVMSFIYLSSGIQNITGRVGVPIGGLFSAFGLFAGITAGTIRSINRRLDQAGIADDPKHPTSQLNVGKTQDAASGRNKAPV